MVVVALTTCTIAGVVALRHRPIARAVSSLSGVAIALLGGLTYGTAIARPPDAARLSDHPRGVHGPWKVRGRLQTDPMRAGLNWSTDLAVETIFVDGVWKAWPLLVRTAVREAGSQPKWVAGDRFETFLRLRPDRPARNPLVGTRATLRASGADVRASLKSFRQLRRRPGGPLLPRWPITVMRGSIRRSTAALFPTRAPLIDALLLGERNEVPGALLAAMARTGLIHVIAISGLHVGIFVSALFAGLRVLGLPIAGAAVVCLLALPLIYMLVVPRPAVARACLMAASFLCGIALGRRTSAFNGLALATLLLTFRDPWVTRDMGFLLSTTATAAILAVGVPTSAPNPIVRVLTGSLVVSCAAQIGVAPVLAATTHRLPLAAIPLNLVAVSATGVAVVAAAGALGMHAVGADHPAHLLATVTGMGLDTIQGLVGIADAPGRGLEVPATAVGWIFPSALAAIALLAYRRTTTHRPRSVDPLLGAPLALVLVAVAPVVAMVTANDVRPRSGDFRLVALDIGQGDSLLVETEDETVLVDTGGRPGSDFDPGTAIIAPALRARGVRSLDAVAITHFHADHAGGLRGLLAEIPTRQVWTPGTTSDDRASRLLGDIGGAVPVVTLGSGDIRRRSGCMWRVLHPPGRSLETGGSPVSNNRSLVLAMGCAGPQVLLTGDTERAAESEYVAGSGQLRSAVLKSPHHGSSTSSSDVLLDAIDARHVVISVGWRNRFGLPDDTVLERYRNRRMAVYRTDRDGAVTVDVGARIRVRGERWSAGRGLERRGGWLH